MTEQEIFDEVITKSKFVGFINIYNNLFPVFKSKKIGKVVIAQWSVKNEINLHRFFNEVANRGCDWPGTNDTIKINCSFLLWHRREVKIC